MRVLHVIASMNPADGGPPVVAASLAAAQASSGADVRLICYTGGDSASYADDALLREMPGGDRVRLVRVAPPTRAERLLGSRARAAVRAELAAGVDVVHLHNVWEAINRVAGVEARRARVPYACTPNGMLDPWALSQSAAKKRVALALGYRTMLDRAAALHVLNDDERRLIEPLALRARTCVIPNGVFPAAFEPRPTRGAFRATRPAIGDRPFVLFLSRLHFKKGLDFLAEAFARVAKNHPTLHLVVAGPDGGARGAFETSVAAAGLGDRVHVVGPLYGRAKLEACVDAACFCLPSRQEGFSMAIVEAMACGTPVVISENCHFPEVATEDAGVVVSLNADAVADGIERVIADPVEARRLGDRGRELILTRYTWERIAARMVEMYQAAIDAS